MNNLIPALIWKYGKTFKAKQDGGADPEITVWDSPLPQPSPSEFENIIKDYEKSEEERLQNRKKGKKEIMQKLGISKNDIPALIALIEDRSDE